MSDAVPPAFRSDPGHAPRPARDRTWHAGWALGQAAVASAALLVVGEAALSAAVALAVAAIPGLLGAAWGPGRARTGVMLLVWTAAAAASATLAGGAASPLAAELVTPAAAALLMGAGPVWAAGLAVAAAAFAALIGQGGGFGPGLESGLDAWLGWAVAATVAVAVASAWALARVGEEIAVSGFEPVAPARPAAVEGEGGPDFYAEERLRAAEIARKEAEAERDRALEAASARSRFLAHMSHELRTPLNAVIGFSDIMRTRVFGPMPERYGEYAQLIHESGEHLLGVINDVLDLAKVEAGRYELRREVFDAREALNGALRLVRGQADEAGVDLRGALPDHAILVDADPRALKQMALNLLSNALKFTGRGGSVTAALSQAGGVLELLVSDTGVGIAPEELTRLGRPFEQGEAARERQGTGLGLSLVRSFAALHGGEMRIESELGTGTAVAVRMPVLAPAEPVETTAETAAVVEAEPAQATPTEAPLADVAPVDEAPAEAEAATADAVPLGELSPTEGGSAPVAEAAAPAVVAKASTPPEPAAPMLPFDAPSGTGGEEGAAGREVAHGEQHGDHALAPRRREDEL